MDCMHDSLADRGSVSGPDGRRSMPSLESDPGGGFRHVGARRSLLRSIVRPMRIAFQNFQPTQPYCHATEMLLKFPP
jgi:hypothetical protein